MLTSKQSVESIFTATSDDMVTKTEIQAESVQVACLTALKEQEAKLADCRGAADESRRELQERKQEVRRQEFEDRQKDGADSCNGEGEFERCNFRELDQLVMRDVGNRIGMDKRWPVLIDLSRQVNTFFRYFSLTFASKPFRNRILLD